MGNFCKGLLLGVIGGAVVGAVVVAKNKKFSTKIKDGVEVVENKFNEVKDSIEEKISKNKCKCNNSSNNENEV